MSAETVASNLAVPIQILRSPLEESIPGFGVEEDFHPALVPVPYTQVIRHWHPRISANGDISNVDQRRFVYFIRPSRSAQRKTEKYQAIFGRIDSLYNRIFDSPKSYFENITSSLRHIIVTGNELSFCAGLSYVFDEKSHCVVIVFLGVESGCRNEGYGSFLLVALLKFLIGSGVEPTFEIYLQCHPDILIYFSTFGFIETEVLPYRDDDESGLHTLPDPVRLLLNSRPLCVQHLRSETVCLRWIHVRAPSFHIPDCRRKLLPLQVPWYNYFSHDGYCFIPNFKIPLIHTRHCYEGLYLLKQTKVESSMRKCVMPLLSPYGTMLGGHILFKDRSIMTNDTCMSPELMDAFLCLLMLEGHSECFCIGPSVTDVATKALVLFSTFVHVRQNHLKNFEGKLFVASVHQLLEYLLNNIERLHSRAIFMPLLLPGNIWSGIFFINPLIVLDEDSPNYQRLFRDSAIDRFGYMFYHPFGNEDCLDRELPDTETSGAFFLIDLFVTVARLYKRENLPSDLPCWSTPTEFHNWLQHYSVPGDYSTRLCYQFRSSNFKEQSRYGTVLNSPTSIFEQRRGSLCGFNVLLFLMEFGMELKSESPFPLVPMGPYSKRCRHLLRSNIGSYVKNKTAVKYRMSSNRDYCLVTDLQLQLYCLLDRVAFTSTHFVRDDALFKRRCDYEDWLRGRPNRGFGEPAMKSALSPYGTRWRALEPEEEAEDVAAAEMKAVDSVIDQRTETNDEVHYFNDHPSETNDISPLSDELAESFDISSLSEYSSDNGSIFTDQSREMEEKRSSTVGEDSQKKSTKDEKSKPKTKPSLLRRSPRNHKSITDTQIQAQANKTKKNKIGKAPETGSNIAKKKKLQHPLTRKKSAPKKTTVLYDVNIIDRTRVQNEEIIHKQTTPLLANRAESRTETEKFDLRSEASTTIQRTIETMTKTTIVKEAVTTIDTVPKKKLLRAVTMNKTPPKKTKIPHNVDLGDGSDIQIKESNDGKSATQWSRRAESCWGPDQSNSDLIGGKVAIQKKITKQSSTSISTTEKKTERETSYIKPAGRHKKRMDDRMATGEETAYMKPAARSKKRMDDRMVTEEETAYMKPAARPKKRMDDRMVTEEETAYIKPASLPKKRTDDRMEEETAYMKPAARPKKRMDDRMVTEEETAYIKPASRPKKRTDDRMEEVIDGCLADLYSIQDWKNPTPPKFDTKLLCGKDDQLLDVSLHEYTAEYFSTQQPQIKNSTDDKNDISLMMKELTNLRKKRKLCNSSTTRENLKQEMDTLNSNIEGRKREYQNKIETISRKFLKSRNRTLMALSFVVNSENKDWLGKFQYKSMKECGKILTVIIELDNKWVESNIEPTYINAVQKLSTECQGTNDNFLKVPPRRKSEDKTIIKAKYTPSQIVTEANTTTTVGIFEDTTIPESFSVMFNDSTVVKVERDRLEIEFGKPYVNLLQNMRGGGSIGKNYRRGFVSIPVSALLTEQSQPNSIPNKFYQRHPNTSAFTSLARALSHGGMRGAAHEQQSQPNSIPNKFYQRHPNTSAFTSFARALSHGGMRGAAHELHQQGQTTYFYSHKPVPCLLRKVHLMKLGIGIKKLKREKNSLDYVTSEQSKPEHKNTIFLIVLGASDGSPDNVICVLDGLIFDANENKSIKFCPSNLEYCCRKKNGETVARKMICAYFFNSANINCGGNAGVHDYYQRQK